MEYIRITFLSDGSAWLTNSCRTKPQSCHCAWVVIEKTGFPISHQSIIVVKNLCNRMEQSNLYKLALPNLHIINGRCQPVQIAAPPPNLREGLYSDTGKCCTIPTAYY